MVYVDGLTAKCTLIAFIQQTASSVSSEKSTESAALISAMPVVVDIGFIGGGAGLAEGCGSGTVGGGAVVNEVVKAGGLAVDIAGGTEVTRGVTGGKELVIETLDCELEGGRRAMCLGGEGRNAGWAVY